MLSHNRKAKLFFLKIMDLFIMTISFGLAALFIHQNIYTVSLSEFLVMRIKVQNFMIFSAALVIWSLIFKFAGLYLIKNIFAIYNTVIIIVQSTLAGSVLLFLFGMMFDIEIITPLYIVVFFLSSSVLLIVYRLIFRLFLQLIRKFERNSMHLVVVGTNKRAVQFVKRIESSNELGYKLVGFVDDSWEGIDEFHKSGYSLVANFENFSEYIRYNVVDQVVIGLPLKSLYNIASQIALLCEKHGIVTHYSMEIFDLKIAKSHAQKIAGNPFVLTSSGTIRNRLVWLKMPVDFILSLSMIILLAPTLAVVALLIKLTSSGPVLFKQKRIGLNKRVFYLYKFRTMVQDAEEKQASLEHLNEATGPVFKIENDPRITTIGKFLRKSSLDELPQLFNVLKADMSLVGPRPLPLRDYHGFYDDSHRRRFCVKPGLTCLWQINGRNMLTFDQWMDMDMEYIDNWSILLDIKILLKTIPVVLKGSGAS